MGSMKNSRRRYTFNNSIAFIIVVFGVASLLVMLVSVLRLPEVLQEDKRMGLYGILKGRKMATEDVRLGELGNMMVGMLPNDLAFTVFVPSERAFGRDLKLGANDTSTDNTYAILSRVLGFSAVPESLHSIDVPLGKETAFDSISGFKLHVSRRLDGAMVVNGVCSERVDLRKGEIVIHIMNGVVMDADFEQSVQSENEAED